MAKPKRSRNEEVADKLHSSAIHLLRSLRSVDEESGLTGPRMSALSVLVFGGPKTLGQLATIEQVKPPTMTRLVTALEEDGLVRRQSDKDDGRLTMIHATAKGEKVMAAGRSRRVLALAARLKKMPPAQIRELERAAELIADVARSDSP